MASVGGMSTQPSASQPAAEIGVIGGSGFYSFLDDIEEVRVETPYGPPSDPIAIGELAGRRVAFVPGTAATTGSRRTGSPTGPTCGRCAPSASGRCWRRARSGPHPEYGPGTLAVPDQLADRTSGREQTYYDEGAAVHVSFADPYCPAGRRAAVASARASGWDPVDRGTLVVIEGPRFSTRAESQWFASQGWTLIGMTGHPEAVLARELALCYTSLCLVTDLDAGIEEGEGVTMEEVLRVFGENIDRLRGLVADVVKALPAERSCPCPDVLDGIKLPLELP